MNKEIIKKIENTKDVNIGDDDEYKINHLIICQHGLHGSFEDFNSIISIFKKQNYKNCKFISAKSNSYFLATHDGIDKIGNRLFHEVKQLYEKYNKPKKISFIGHSLGGLIIRYAIGLLYKDGFFQYCQPDQYISLSSPHCGSRRPSTSIFNKIAHIFVDNCLSVTGKQLILHDTEIPDNIDTFPDTSKILSSKKNTINNSNNNNNNDEIIISSPPDPKSEKYAISPKTEEDYKKIGINEKLKIIEKKEENEVVTNDQEIPIPLLVKMTEGIFFEGLKLFRKRILYSNIYNDIQVNFCTSDISAKNPYTLGKVMKFTEKYKHIIEEETLLDVDPKLLEEQVDNNDDSKNQQNQEISKKIYIIKSNNQTNQTQNQNQNQTQTQTQPQQQQQQQQQQQSSQSSKEKNDVDDHDKYFTHDTHHIYLKRILKNLRKLNFDRYHIYFKSFLLPHTNIVVKRDWINSDGWDVVNHLVDTFQP